MMFHWSHRCQDHFRCLVIFSGEVAQFNGPSFAQCLPMKTCGRIVFVYTIYEIPFESSFRVDNLHYIYICCLVNIIQVNNINDKKNLSKCRQMEWSLTKVANTKTRKHRFPVRLTCRPRIVMMVKIYAQIIECENR